MVSMPTLSDAECPEGKDQACFNSTSPAHVPTHVSDRLAMDVYKCSAEILGNMKFSGILKVSVALHR